MRGLFTVREGRDIDLYWDDLFSILLLELLSTPECWLCILSWLLCLSIPSTEAGIKNQSSSIEWGQISLYQAEQGSPYSLSPSSFCNQLIKLNQVCTRRSKGDRRLTISF